MLTEWEKYDECRGDQDEDGAQETNDEEPGNDETEVEQPRDDTEGNEEEAARIPKSGFYTLLVSHDNKPTASTSPSRAPPFQTNSNQ